MLGCTDVVHAVGVSCLHADQTTCTTTLGSQAEAVMGAGVAMAASCCGGTGGRCLQNSHRTAGDAATAGNQGMLILLLVSVSLEVMPAHSGPRRCSSCLSAPVSRCCSQRAGQCRTVAVHACQFGMCPSCFQARCAKSASADADMLAAARCAIRLWLRPQAYDVCSVPLRQNPVVRAGDVRCLGWGGDSSSCAANRVIRGLAGPVPRQRHKCAALSAAESARLLCL